MLSQQLIDDHIIMSIIDNLPPRSLMIFTGLGILTYFLLNFLCSVCDPLEPPMATTRIPYIGHILGLGRRKFNYYVDLSQKTRLPILTIRVPGVKMYIVNTTELIQAVQKLHKKLAFPPISAKFANQLCGVSRKAREVLAVNVNGDEGDWGLNMEATHVMKMATAPGPGLDAMNRVMVGIVAESLDGLIGEGKESVEIGLHAWLRALITMATTESIYGPRNPYRDVKVQDSFWELESQMMRLLVGILPSIFARKGVAARRRVTKAFESYYARSGLKDASLLAQARLEVNVKHGVPIKDVARYETVIGVAIIVNTAPALFWLIFFIFSNSKLLGEIRGEIEAIVETSCNEDGSLTRSLDITNVKTKCHLLLSTFQETLRHRSAGTSVRIVMEDTLLDDTWLLKKNSIIQMPGRVIHMDSKIWGPDVADFNPRRFLKDKNIKRPNPAAFRTFGGGTTLCPGRHFATNEILAVVSMFVMRFDMRPAKGEWKLPKSDNTNVTTVIMEPDTDINVVVSQRKEVGDGNWTFKLSDSKTTASVVVEDRVDS
ncbi:hypothetical protein BGAL_0024g00540 [Botrytis galanthina]|uniref:Cytochrome P450 n=1 Tax=Botrytis galanthina TaxID=278940 RepID=A0A4S8R998_9HELO|nr:hypothetical protein BGAL_0024g00540 [Botrytis galanthina]